MIEMTDTLCISCSNACNGRCNWSDSLTPVDGWETKESGKGINIVACTKYVEDDEHRGRPDSFDKDGVMLLLEAAVRQMRYDYELGLGPAGMRSVNRKLIEKFLRSERGKKLLQLSDVDEVIEQLRVLAKRHDQRMMIR